jgi:hypothetical protein
MFSFLESKDPEFAGVVPRRMFVGKLASPEVTLASVENLDAIPAKNESVSVRELDAFNHGFSFFSVLSQPHIYIIGHFG